MTTQGSPGQPLTEQILGELNATLRVSAEDFQQPWVHI